MENILYFIVAILCIAAVISVIKRITRNNVVKRVETLERFTVYELTKRANFKQMFRAITKNLDSIRVSGLGDADTDNVETFIKLRPSLFHKEGSYLLLHKNEEEYFVIVAHVNADSVSIENKLFKHDIPLNEGCYIVTERTHIPSHHG